jgi:2-polyprenyl-6-methoxyphenol hydroxylase-like FAD-dependent oxidoreductase
MSNANGSLDLPKEIPVLVIGGSMVGLSSAMFLAWHGIPVISIERHKGTAIHPRAGFFQLRTLELMRVAGIDREVTAASHALYDPDGGLNAVETLAGKEIAQYIPNINTGVQDISPVTRLFMPQQVLEPILWKRAEELGAEFRFESEVTKLDQDADGVTVTVRSLANGEEGKVRAQYVVACDGNRSPARERLGIKMKGHGQLSHSVTIYFRADCSKALRNRNLGVIYVTNPDLRGFFRLEKTGMGGFLVVFTVGDIKQKGARNVADIIDEKLAIKFVRQAVGDPDLEVDVLDIAKWKAVADCAERFQEGRVLFAGDAAHTMPPTGGYGGNTGVQDAQNLAWKLAHVIQGHAGPKLVDTYNQERWPVGRMVVEQAYNRYVTRSDPDLGMEGVEAPIPDIHIELGNRYRSASVIPDDPADDGQPHIDPRVAQGRPGTRGPHVVLERGGKEMSILDLYGSRFVLVAGPGGEAWANAAKAAAKSVNVPLDAYHLGGTGKLTDPKGTFHTAYGITPAGAVLVRPDGYVAWRAKDASGATPAAMEAVLKRLLCR